MLTLNSIGMIMLLMSNIDRATKNSNQSILLFFNIFPIDLFSISYLNIFAKSHEDIFIAVSKIDRHFKASYFSVYKLKRLREIEKKCIKWNVRNY